ncbi:YfdX family protein [Candidatus Protochlamydia phocaeensis]|uniref:YfdX family protein n=1 Tax=Candidatus Protochlamydia phocaeensis TaxID=1414722 RepID=UPI000839AA6F|nr:YfdX family protein [Candidatus Protochlamydia phocaeensis]
MYKSSAFPFKAWSIALGLLACGSSLEAQQSPSSGSKPSTGSQTNIPAPLPQSQPQQRLEIEKQRKQVEEEIRKSIIPEAVAVLKETEQAIKLIWDGDNKGALAAIERASGKIDVLLAQHPDSALLPLDFNIDVIDDAPLSLDRIREISKTAERAVKDGDYPEGRLLLDALQSEIDIETYSLPLAIYPPALKRAANLLNHNASQEAGAVLETALTSIVIINRLLPIPLINAKALLALSEDKYKNNRDLALKLLDGTRYELERARALGYITKEEDEYKDLNEAIKDLQKQINSNTGNPSMFHSLKERFQDLIKRHFDKKKTTNGQQTNTAQES